MHSSYVQNHIMIDTFCCYIECIAPRTLNLELIHINLYTPYYQFSLVADTNIFLLKIIIEDCNSNTLLLTQALLKGSGMTMFFV